MGWRVKTDTSNIKTDGYRAKLRMYGSDSSTDLLIVLLLQSTAIPGLQQAALITIDPGSRLPHSKSTLVMINKESTNFR